jgi:hypothetical protein
MLSSQDMIVNQLRKSKDDSPALLNYFSSTDEKDQVALLECANVSSILYLSINRMFVFFLKFILFKELSTSFHPQIIYMIVSSIDDVLKCFFSVDCHTSFSILVNR